MEEIVLALNDFLVEKSVHECALASVGVAYLQEKCVSERHASVDCGGMSC